jgi:ABC-type bacteriocin/lantibiotic exporter with double-glycine peptidase domain
MIGVDIAIKFLKENPKFIWTNLFFMMVMPILELFVPKLYGELFNKPTKESVYANLFKLVVLLMAYQVLGEFNNLNNDLQYFKLDNEITYTIIHNLFLSKRSSGNGDQFTSTILGEIHRLQEIVREWYYQIKRFIVPYIVFFVVATVYLFYLHPYLGACMVLLLFANICLIIGSAYGCRKETISLNNSFEVVLRETEDILSNVQSIQAEGREAFEMSVIKKISEEYDSVSIGIIKCALKYRVIGNIMLGIFLFTITRVAYNLYNTNKIKLATLITIFFIIRHNLDSNSRIMAIVENSSYHYGIINKMGNLLELPTQELVTLDQPSLKTVDIKFKNVYFKYPGSQRYILDNLNLHIKDGDRIAIIGDIGSGKSTILKLIMKLYLPAKGNIYLNGQSYDEISHIKLFSNIGYMPQSPVLFNRSIMDNIKYGREHMKDEVIVKLLKDFGVYEQFSNLDKGLYTRIGKGGSKISGGQKQIIWFLRIFLKNPPVLILDEPTASLDINTKKIMSQLIEKVLHGKTIIMITHDEFLMKFAKRRLEMGNKRIISDTVVGNSSDDNINLM